MATEKTKTVKDLIDLLGGASNVAKYEALKSYLLNDDESIADEEAPYEEKYQAILSNPAYRAELMQGFKPFLKRVANVGMAQKKGDKDVTVFSPLPMTMDNIAQALSEASAVKNAEDVLDYKDAYASIPGRDMQKLFEAYGWDMPTVMDYIRNEQTKAARQKVYDDTNLLTKMMFPRSSEAIKEGRDFTPSEMGVDIAENALQLMSPSRVFLGPSGLSAKAAKALGGSLKALDDMSKLRKIAIARQVMDNALVPISVAEMDYALGNKSRADALEQALTGTAINSMAGKAMPRILGGLTQAPQVVRWLEKHADDGFNSYSEAIAKARNVVKNADNFAEDEVKDARNFLTVIQNPEFFTNKNGSIFDFASGTRQSAKVGKANRKAYETELKGSKDEWANNVRGWEESLKNDPTAYDQYTRLRRESVFPHNFVDAPNVGAKDGVIRLNKGVSGLGGDLPEFKIYNNADFGESLEKELADELAKHHSKTFQYATPGDKVIAKAVTPTDRAEALKYIYGASGLGRLVQDANNYLANKLGRSNWLDAQKQEIKKHVLPEKEKKKEDEE